jgi:hypothetical protein
MVTITVTMRQPPSHGSITGSSSSGGMSFQPAYRRDEFATLVDETLEVVGA